MKKKIKDTLAWENLVTESKELPSIKDLASTQIAGSLKQLNSISESLTYHLQENKNKYENEAKLFKRMQAIEVLNTMESIFEIFPDLKQVVSNNFSSKIDININKTMPAIWSYGSIHSLLRNDNLRKYKINDLFDIDH